MGNAQVLKGSHCLQAYARVVDQVVEPVRKKGCGFLCGFLDARDVRNVELNEGKAILGVYCSELSQRFCAEVASCANDKVLLLFQLEIAG